MANHNHLVEIAKRWRDCGGIFDPPRENLFRQKFFLSDAWISCAISKSIFG
jgi:hypothetical protein